MGAFNIPFSNRAGNNQTTPGAGVGLPAPIIASPGIGTGSIPSNPYSPIPAGSTNTGNNPGVAPTAPAGGVAAPQPITTGGQATNIAPIVPGGTVSNNLQKQLTDIYGQGTGASLFNLLNNMSGTNSASLQEYIQSLQPSFAQSQATINTTLGEQGVGANSSVNAIAQSNLQSQENADISGESAQLTQSEQQLSAQILESTMPGSEQETAESGWNILGNVLNGIGSDIGPILTGAANVQNANTNSQNANTLQALAGL
jgi:hypothetical protein